MILFKDYDISFPIPLNNIIYVFKYHKNNMIKPNKQWRLMYAISIGNI